MISGFQLAIVSWFIDAVSPFFFTTDIQILGALRVVGHPQKSGLRKAGLYFGNAQLFGYLFKCKIESGEIVLWMIRHFSYITKFEKKFTIYRVEENGPSTTATNCLSGLSFVVS